MFGISRVIIDFQNGQSGEYIFFVSFLPDFLQLVKTLDILNLQILNATQNTETLMLLIVAP